MSDKSLPPFKEPYKLTDEHKYLLDRIKEELESRTKADVSFDVYKQNALVYPTPRYDIISIEVRIGNWRRIHQISEAELEFTAGPSFYYFVRRLADDTMMDLTRIGAARA
jgi:hypothetical protein